MNGDGSERADVTSTGHSAGRLNRVVLEGVVAEGPTLIHQRDQRVVVRLRVEVRVGQPSIAVSMFDPPAAVALTAMTAGPGSTVFVMGHLEFVVDLEADRPDSLVVVADRLVFGAVPSTA